MISGPGVLRSIAACSLTLAACLGSHPAAVDTLEVVLAVRGGDVSVPFGARDELRALAVDDTALALSTIAQCRPASFVAARVGLAVDGSARALAERRPDVLVRPTEVWDGAVTDCSGAVAMPAAGRTVRIALSFGRAKGFTREARTDAAGVVRFPGYGAMVQQLADACGDATIVATEASPPRGGEPGALSIVVPASGRPSLDSLTGPPRALAQRCLERRRDRCAAKLDGGAIAELSESCRDACARRANATSCELAERACVDRATDDEGVAACGSGSARCLEVNGVDPDERARCTSDCLTLAEAQACS